MTGEFNRLVRGALCASLDSQGDRILRVSRFHSCCLEGRSFSEAVLSPMCIYSTDEGIGDLRSNAFPPRTIHRRRCMNSGTARAGNNWICAILLGISVHPFLWESPVRGKPSSICGSPKADRKLPLRFTNREGCGLDLYNFHCLALYSGPILALGWLVSNNACIQVR